MRCSCSVPAYQTAQMNPALSRQRAPISRKLVPEIAYQREPRNGHHFSYHPSRLPGLNQCLTKLFPVHRLSFHLSALITRTSLPFTKMPTVRHFFHPAIMCDEKEWFAKLASFNISSHFRQTQRVKTVMGSSRTSIGHVSAPAPAKLLQHAFEHL